MTHYKLFATAPKGLESLLAEELRGMGAQEVAETRAGVAFAGDLELAYRVCLWSRLASRVLLPLMTFPAPDSDALYEQVLAWPWEEHMEAEGTLAVSAQVIRSRVDHSRFAALRIKDGIVDRFRDRFGVRPSIDVQHPDLRINLYLFNDQATLSIDLSGESLHRRGYRAEGVLAPLKENLAAAILLRAGWLDVAAAGGSLLDPMCGSGTLPIEAALMASDSAPGLNRSYYGFLGWKGHCRETWKRLLLEARDRRKAGLARLPVIVGCDTDPAAVRGARINADQAGLGGLVRFEQRDLTGGLHPFPEMEQHPGLLVVNPPYGERLGEVGELRPLYAALGESLRNHFIGWKGAVFTGNPDLAKQMAIRARRRHTLYNGALECRLLHFTIDPQWFFGADIPEGTGTGAARKSLSSGATMFANRLKKNARQLKRWAQREGVTCYRLYDADMPEYSVAVDLYEQWVHVQEYQAPATIDPDQAHKRLGEVMEALPEALDILPDRIFLKVRRRQTGSSQYDKLASRGQMHEVREGNCRFLVNFTDYLDTGLFLDHRPTRQMIQDQCSGKRFLNLFGYTGSATVHAARGSASATVTVDMSRTYLDWARKNLTLNGFQEGPRHRLVQEDCLKWLERESARQAERFDLIFLDPPTFSNSKGMEGVFDVQRDHVALLHQAVRLLAKDGVLLFSNNNRRFKMDEATLPDLLIEDISKATIPPDFARNPRIHNCWRISKKSNE